MSSRHYHDLLSEEPFLPVQKGKKHRDLWIQDS